MKLKKAGSIAWMLTLAMTANVMTAFPVHADTGGKAGESGNVITRVAYNDEKYDRSTVLEVSGEPFWYNGIQIRIDKLRDDPHYAFDDNTMQKLFDQVKEDGFTTAACQIRWSDIQPNHTLHAIDTSYIYGGKNADTSYKGNAGTWIQYDANDESKQGLGYLKFSLEGKKPEEIDGAKIRLFNRNSLGAPRKVEVYAIEDDSWNRETLTWNNAPGHNGYEVTGVKVAESPGFDWVKNYGYYDLDITEFIKTSDWAKDGTVSFIIREGSGQYNDPNTKIVFGDFNDYNMPYDGIKIDARPQLIYSDADEFDFTYLDQAIEFAKNSGLKFEVLWFGLDTVNFSSDLRVPCFVYSNYRFGQDEKGNKFEKRDSLTSTTGKYRYFMCKNDEALVEAEAKAIKAAFDHIAERGDDVVIGCQLSNEPGVGWWFSNYSTPHCMCSVCMEKKADQNTEDFKTATLWDYNNKLGEAVKISKYSVWTRVNLIQGYSTQIVKMNEEKKKTDESYIDFIGVDLYVTPPSGLALLGIPGQPFAWETNLPMVMELGQKDDRNHGLYLEEDVLATLSGGAYCNIYDAISGDGCQIYSYNKDTGVFSPYKASGESGEEAVVSALFRTNHMLNKIGYDLAVKAPGEAGNNKLVYFNAASDRQNKHYEKNRVVGGNKSITFSTDANGVGIVVDKGKDEAAFLSTRNHSFVINNLNTPEAVTSAELGYYDETNQWVKESDFNGIQNKDGKIIFEVPQYECLRLTFSDGVWGEAEEFLELKVEAEANYELSEGVNAETWDDGASGGKWVKVLSGKNGDAITIKANIPQNGVYELNTCYRTGNNRGTVQLTVDGEKVGNPIDMYEGSSRFYLTDPADKIRLTEGEHEFTYTVVGKNGKSSGYGMGLDYINLTQTERFVDSSGLEEVYKNLKDTERGNYTDETWNTFQEQLEKTRILLEKGSFSQSELDNQKNLLQSAFDNLLENTDRSRDDIIEELRGLLDKAREEVKKTDRYPKAAIDKLETEIGTLDRLIDSPEIGRTAQECLKRLKAFQNVYDEFLDSAFTMFLWIDEDFENTEGSFGFASDARITDGRLFVTNEMANEATSVKKFEPEIMGQSEVKISFDWTSEVTDKKGKSGIEFRDSYGRLIFALLGCYNENGSGTKRELRYSVTAEDSDSSKAKYICEPKWTKADKPLEPSQTYHVEFHADFANQMLDVTVTDHEGTEVVRKEDLKIKGLNLAKMAACNYWSVEPQGKRYPSSQTIDNFKLFVSDDGDELILKDQSMYAFGDSIMCGHAYPKAGPAEFTAEKEGMELQKFAVNNASIMEGSSEAGTILEQISEAPSEEVSYILFNGGTEDLESIRSGNAELGELSAGKDPAAFDASAFAGAFEKTVYSLKEKWPEAHIVYLAAHKMGSGDAELQEKMYDLVTRICAKWDIAVADIYKKLDTTDQEKKSAYTFDQLGANGLPGKNGSGKYPNFKAVEEYYVPTIIGVLRELAVQDTNEADKSGLRALIAAAEMEASRTDCYTSESIEELKKAITEAKKAADDKKASEEDVKNQMNSLQKAMDEMKVLDSAYYTYAIKVTKKPSKEAYKIGEAFNPDGMEVTAYEKASCSNATVSNASKREKKLDRESYDVEYEPFDSAGEKRITVVYHDLSDSFTVTVGGQAEERYYAVGIEIERKPDKTEYEAGQEFDPTGMKVLVNEKASPSNAVRSRLLEEDEYEIEHESFDDAGTKKVTVIYRTENSEGGEAEFKRSFTVKVTEVWEAYYTTGIKLKSKPDKTTYEIGEDFDSAGMKVVAYEKASSSNAARRERVLTEDEYDMEIPSFATPGTKTVRILYEAQDKSGNDKVFRDSFTVKVRKGSSSGDSSDSSYGSSGTVYDGSITGTWSGGKDQPWRFRKSDGTYAADEWVKVKGLWYHFDASGNMQTGWIFDQGKWYMLNADGIMHSNIWILVNEKWYFLNADGSMKCNEWFLYNGFWYYLGKDGDMVTDCMTPDGYRVNDEGKWVQ